MFGGMITPDALTLGLFAFGTAGVVALAWKYFDVARDGYRKACDARLDKHKAELSEMARKAAARNEECLAYAKEWKAYAESVAETCRAHQEEADMWCQKYEEEHARAEALQAQIDARPLYWRLVGSEGEPQTGRLVAVWIDGNGPFTVALSSADKDVLPGHEVDIEADGSHVKGFVTHVDYRISF